MEIIHQYIPFFLCVQGTDTELWHSDASLVSPAVEVQVYVFWILRGSVDMLLTLSFQGASALDASCNICRYFMAGSYRIGPTGNTFIRTQHGLK